MFKTVPQSNKADDKWAIIVYNKWLKIRIAWLPNEHFFECVDMADMNTQSFVLQTLALTNSCYNILLLCRFIGLLQK